VAGVDEAKEELVELVEFLKHPGKFAALGAHIPKGVLLLGPPATGKTLLARAVAGEAGVAFFSISGSQFVELYVGVGAGRVRDLFAEAKRNAPCIVFLDEIDAVGRLRGAGLGGSHDEREQTLNQILVEMDGFQPGTNIVVIAATNRPDILDPALVRPGRFDRKVVLDAPDVGGRKAILEVHLRGKPVADDVDVEQLARTTPGFTGADLANLVNEAAILSARANKRRIGMHEFAEAIDRVVAGPERKSRIMSYEERRLIAYHESGHVVVAHFMEHHDRPEKVTIVSRGMAAGYTRFLPEQEAHFQKPETLQDQICAALGGRAAERLVFGSASTGPSNDLEQISRLARSMVTRWGMSEDLGPITYGRAEELVLLGREISETRNYSEETAGRIDSEVRRIVDEAEQRAYQILVEHRPLLDHLAATLLERETLQGPELAAILDSDPPRGRAPVSLPEQRSEPGDDGPAQEGTGRLSAQTERRA
jgi:cell division protease FtsH